VKTRTIRQTVTIPAAPAEVYRLLMTSKGHEAFTGAPARISPRVGGTFTAWGGYIHGKNVALLPGKTIVQEWRPEEEGWPDDYYSKVTYRLIAVPGGTRISFTHSGVLAEHAGHLTSGWRESYWDPLKHYFARPDR
jgi:uncharacterized protein YndB with AHSA1/START domain